jgi:hypothetical protein
MHWDQNIIFIIIAAIVGISRLIARISEESKKRSQRPPQLPRAPGRPEYTQPVQRTQPKTDADRIREFLEALGQPAGTAPPPKVQPRTQIPRDRSHRSNLQHRCGHSGSPNSAPGRNRWRRSWCCNSLPNLCLPQSSASLSRLFQPKRMNRAHGSHKNKPKPLQPQRRWQSQPISPSHAQRWRHSGNKICVHPIPFEPQSFCARFSVHRAVCNHSNFRFKSGSGCFQLKQNGGQKPSLICQRRRRQAWWHIRQCSTGNSSRGQVTSPDGKFQPCKEIWKPGTQEPTRFPVSFVDSWLPDLSSSTASWATTFLISPFRSSSFRLR